MTVGAAAEYHTRVELTAAALEKGKAFYDANAAAIETYAQRIGTATSKLDEMRRALEASQEAQKALAAEASSAVEGMIFDAKSLNEALSDVAKNLARMLITGGIAGTGPFAGILGTASTTGGAGGLFGSLFAGAFAGGGTIPAVKLGIVGEDGPEVAAAGRQPLTIIPPHKLPAGAGAGVTIVNQTNISAPGADAEKLARVETAVREMQRKDGARAVEAVMKFRRGRCPVGDAARISGSSQAHSASVRSLGKPALGSAAKPRRNTVNHPDTRKRFSVVLTHRVYFERPCQGASLDA